MLGGAHPLNRQAQRQKSHHYNPYYSPPILMLIPGSEGDAMSGAQGDCLYKSASAAYVFLPGRRFPTIITPSNLLSLPPAVLLYLFLNISHCERLLLAVLHPSGLCAPWPKDKV